ncbi:MAG: cation diffusion facilitator family transporter [Bacteroidota bacterium]
MNREQKIIRASWVAILGNSLLALLKITLGIASGSYAVVADGIDSSTDILTSLITLITARIISRPPNIKYPYGYEKADTVATKALSFIIFFAGAQLAISTVEKIISGETAQLPARLAVYVTLFSIVGKLLLSLYLFAAGRKASSSMLMANAKNMRNDILISLSVLTGLVVTFVFRLPILDRLVALAVSAFIITEAFRIFLRSNTELMDGIPETELYRELFDAVLTVEGASNPHRMRARKIGTYLMINMDIEVDPLLTVKESHDIAKAVENSIKLRIPNVYDVMVHVEPRGNLEHDEKFGVKESDIQNINRIR